MNKYNQQTTMHVHPGAWVPRARVARLAGSAVMLS
jgi:hypothetical protein